MRKMKREFLSLVVLPFFFLSYQVGAYADAKSDYDATKAEGRQQSQESMKQWKEGNKSAQDVEKGWKEQSQKEQDAAKKLEKQWKEDAEKRHQEALKKEQKMREDMEKREREAREKYEKNHICFLHSHARDIQMIERHSIKCGAHKTGAS